MGQICDNAARVCEAIVEFAVSMKWFITAATAVKLCQSIKGRCWEDDKSGRLLQQLKGLGAAMSAKLVSSTPAVVNLNDMEKVSAGKLEGILGKQVGTKLLDELAKVPSYSLLAVLEEAGCSDVTRVNVRLTIESRCASSDSPTYYQFPLLLVGIQDGDANLIEYKVTF
jgi:hypothetical protein